MRKILKALAEFLDDVVPAAEPEPRPIPVKVRDQRRR